MKIKTNSGYSSFKPEQKKPIKNDYRQKLDVLSPGDVLLPTENQPEDIQPKLRAIKPPNKHFRIPSRFHYAQTYFPKLKPKQELDHPQFSVETIIPKASEKKRKENGQNGKKNVQLLNHMIEILQNKQQRQQIPLRISTEPENFNEFANLETGTTKNNRGPILDPKISKFMERTHAKRQIFSEQKNRSRRKYIVGEQNRNSFSKNKRSTHLELITFYNQGGCLNWPSINHKEEEVNQFM